MRARPWPLRNRLPIMVRLLVVAAISSAPACGRSTISARTDTDSPATCGPEVLEAVASTDRTSYRPGETVVVRSTVRNGSSEPCHYASSDFEYTFKTSSGISLGGGASHGDRFSTEPLTLAPKQALTGTGQWDQRDCLKGPDSCRRAASGEYLVDFTWKFEIPVTATTSFQLD